MSVEPASVPNFEGRLVRIAAEARLPSRHGDFRVVAFDSIDGKEHGAIVKGDVRGRADVPLRVHSECFTGDVMGSLKCDCRDQLEAALDLVGREDFGVVLYLRQEGRGIGLANRSGRMPCRTPVSTPSRPTTPWASRMTSVATTSLHR
jgi:GTP cyclohydrolase II